MATKTESEPMANPFEEVFENIRKTASANLEMQQDMMQQWSKLMPGMQAMPGMPTPQAMFTEQAQNFQRDWSNTVTDLVRKHRDVMDRQYQAAIESLEDALRIAESKDPEQFRKRVEQLCRKTLECYKEVTESQMQEFQNAVTKWTELMGKVGS